MEIIPSSYVEAELPEATHNINSMIAKVADEAGVITAFDDTGKDARATAGDTGRMPVLRNKFPQRENTNDPRRKVQAKQARCLHHNQWRHGQDARATTAT